MLFRALLALFFQIGERPENPAAPVVRSRPHHRAISAGAHDEVVVIRRYTATPTVA